MPPVNDDDDELFIEIDDYESAEGGVAPQRFGAPHAQDQHGARQPPSGEGVGRGGIRRPPLLDVEGKYLTNEELSALEDEFEDVTPRKGMKLPGMASTPGTKSKPSGSTRLLQPTFGAMIPKEEFQPEMERELARSFADDKNSPKRYSIASPPLPDEEFVADIVEEADDGIVRFATDDDARADVQNSQLEAAEKELQKLKEQSKKLQEEMKSASELNKQLRNEVKKLKTDHLEMEDRVDELRREGESKGLVQATSKEEEKKFKELEARMKREEAKRKAQELGLEQDDEVFEIAGDRFGIGRRIQQYLKKAKLVFHHLDGMYTVCKRTESRFGSGIALYFWFFRWMILSTALLMLGWLSYFVTHIATFAIQSRRLSFVGIIFPNFLLYSSFPSDWANSYAALIVASLFITLIITVTKFIKEFQLKHKADVYYLDGEPARYAKVAFNAWDWNTFDEDGLKECGARVNSLLSVLKREDTMTERVALRTQKEWTRLYIKRGVGISLNIIVIAAGWGGIIFSKLYLGSSVAANFDGLVAILIKNLPTVVPTAINGILPSVIDLAVDFEAWDDPSTTLKNKVARLYTAKILNALIQVAVVLIFVQGPIALLGGSRIILRDCNYATCEDQVGVTFFTLFMTDVIVGTISGAAVPFATYIGANAVGMKAMAHSEFKPPVQIIKVLYQQIFLWLSLPHFPAVIPVAVLLWFIQLRVDIWVLFTFNAKKVTPFDARDSGVFFATFYTITLFLFALWMYYVFFILSQDTLDLECCRLPALILNGNSTVTECFDIQTVTRDGVEIPNNADVCLADSLSSSGYDSAPVVPFQSLSMSKTLSTAMTADDGSAWIIGTVDSALFGYFVALCMLLLFGYEQMRVRVLEEYLDETIGEIRLSIKQMEDKQRKKQKRIALVNYKEEEEEMEGGGVDTGGAVSQE